jgi:hypothetical protein
MSRLFLISALWSASLFAQAPATPAPASAPTTAAVPPTPAAAAETVKPPPPAGMTADEEYGLKMRQLEETVSELKEQIFRSKAKLTLLTEQVQGGVAAGSKLVINHKNQLGDNILMTQVSYFLDGAPLWQEVDDTGLALSEKRDRPLWDGNIVEGSHTLSVVIQLKGNGTGVFRYMNDYKWKIPERLTFTAEPGKITVIDVVLFEQGNFTTELKDRPKLRFDQNVTVDNSRKTKQPAQATK